MKRARPEGSVPRIAVFIPSLRGGGAERAMLMFAREALSRGYQIDLVVSNCTGPLNAVVPVGVRLVDLKQPRLSFALIPLVRYLIQNRPAALFSTIMHANVLAAVAGRITGSTTPVIVRESNAPISEPKNTFSRRMTYRLVPYTYRSARAIIAVSAGVAAELSEIDPALSPLVQIVGTPVISDEVLRQGNEPLAHPWFQPGQPPVILGAARLQPHKGFLTLLRAFAQLRRSSSARLVILGEGPQRMELEAEAHRLGLAKEVALPGFFENPFTFMHKAQAFVLSSEYEGLPNVLIQAMAFGTPVVATDCKCGPREILAGGSYGKLVPVGDIDAMADAMERALDLPRAEDARRSVLERYSAASVTTAYLRLAGLPASLTSAVSHLERAVVGA